MAELPGRVPVIEQKFRIGQRVHVTSGRGFEPTERLWVVGVEFDFAENRLSYALAERWPPSVGDTWEGWAQEDINP